MPCPPADGGGPPLPRDFIRIAQDTNRQMEQGFSPEELAALHRYLERVAQNLAAQTEETEL